MITHTTNGSIICIECIYNNAWGCLIKNNHYGDTYCNKFKSIYETKKYRKLKDINHDRSQ